MRPYYTSNLLERYLDLIRGTARDEPVDAEDLAQPRHKRQTSIHRDTNTTQVVVAADHEFVVIGTNAHDRPGLLLDISKGLLRLNLSLRHTEAAVVGTRSISIWRCELLDSELPDMEEIWSVLNVSTSINLLQSDAPTKLSSHLYRRILSALGTLGE